MSRFHAPEGSVTESSVRMAFNYEYMVPVEVAWGLEQERNNWREVAQIAIAARDHNRAMWDKCAAELAEARK